MKKYPINCNHCHKIIKGDEVCFLINGNRICEECVDLVELEEINK